MPGLGEHNRRLGSAGEDRAAAWYLGHGYEVLARNWRCPAGEIDLVASAGRVVVFCEVKARSGTAYGTAAEAVGPAKQARLRRLAGRWLREWGGARPGEVRFDVVTVTAGELEVIEAAF